MTAVPEFPAPVAPRRDVRPEFADAGVPVGSARVHAIVDAVVDYPFPLTMFYPDVPSEAWDEWRELFPETFWAEDRHTLAYTAYLVRTPRSTILVDCGMGSAAAPMTGFLDSLPPGVMAAHQPHHLLDGLAAIGVAPGDVDVVALTHLDVDHVGWALTTVAATTAPTFPNARYVVDADDWNAYHTPGWDTKAPFEYLGETVTPLRELGTLDVVTDDVALDPVVTFQRAVGHTPGHRLVRVADGGEVAYLLGDAIVHPAQVTHPQWRNMADVDPDMTRRTRSELLDDIEHENALMAATHFPYPWFGFIARDADRRRMWIPTTAGTGHDCG